MYKNKNKNTRDKAKATQPANAKRTVYYEELDELQLERCAAGKAAKAAGPSGTTGPSNGKVPERVPEYWETQIDPKTDRPFTNEQDWHNWRNNLDMEENFSWLIRDIFSQARMS